MQLSNFAIKDFADVKPLIANQPLLNQALNHYLEATDDETKAQAAIDFIRIFSGASLPEAQALNIIKQSTALFCLSMLQQDEILNGVVGQDICKGVLTHPDPDGVISLLQLLHGPKFAHLFNGSEKQSTVAAILARPCGDLLPLIWILALAFSDNNALSGEQGIKRFTALLEYNNPANLMSLLPRLDHLNWLSGSDAPDIYDAVLTHSSPNRLNDILMRLADDTHERLLPLPVQGRDQSIIHFNIDLSDVNSRNAIIEERIQRAQKLLQFLGKPNNRIEFLNHQHPDIVIDVSTTLLNANLLTDANYAMAIGRPNLTGKESVTDLLAGPEPVNTSQNVKSFKLELAAIRSHDTLESDSDNKEHLDKSEPDSDDEDQYFTPPSTPRS